MIYSKEEMKTIDLDKSGLLYGFNGINYDIIKSYMESVDYDKIKMDETVQCVAPAIRRILTMILETENQKYIFKKEPNTQIEVMGMFDANEIAEGLDKLYSELLPVFGKYLPNIDSQAELTLLFCDNYVYKLIEKAKENEKNY